MKARRRVQRLLARSVVVSREPGLHALLASAHVHRPRTAADGTVLDVQLLPRPKRVQVQHGSLSTIGALRRGVGDERFVHGPKCGHGLSWNTLQAMERSYELTTEDLVEVQAQFLAARRERLVTGIWPLAGSMLLVAVIGWPLAAMLLKQPVLGVPTTRAAVTYLLLLGLAVAIVHPLRKRLPASTRTRRWSAERLGRAMARRSVLGPIHLVVDGAGLTRTNAVGDLRVSAGEVRGVLESGWGLTLQLRGARVIPVPARAHPSPEAAKQFRDAVDALRPPVASPAPRAVRPGLVAVLAYAALVLATQQALAWYHDPRPSNPADHLILYGTTWCPVCARLRTCLRKDGVPFEDRDVDHSPSARAQWEELGGRGVPLLLVGRQVLYGLNPEALQGALAQAGYHVDCR